MDKISIRQSSSDTHFFWKPVGVKKSECKPRPVVCIQVLPDVSVDAIPQKSWVPVRVRRFTRSHLIQRYPSLRQQSLALILWDIWRRNRRLCDKRRRPQIACWYQVRCQSPGRAKYRFPS